MEERALRLAGQRERELVGKVCCAGADNPTVLNPIASVNPTILFFVTIRFCIFITTNTLLYSF